MRPTTKLSELFGAVPVAVAVWNVFGERYGAVAVRNGSTAQADADAEGLAQLCAVLTEEFQEQLQGKREVNSPQRSLPDAASEEI